MGSIPTFMVNQFLCINIGNRRFNKFKRRKNFNNRINFNKRNIFNFLNYFQAQVTKVCDSLVNNIYKNHNINNPINNIPNKNSNV